MKPAGKAAGGFWFLRAAWVAQTFMNPSTCFPLQGHAGRDEQNPADLNIRLAA
jgi:hypothetical protein